MTRRIVLATRNAHKVVELREILADTLAEFDLASEPGNERLAMERVGATLDGLNLSARRRERLKTAVAEATAGAIERIATAIRQPGGEQAVQLKVAEKAVEAYARVASDATTTLIIPSNMTELSTLISSAMKMIQTHK